QCVTAEAKDRSMRVRPSVYEGEVERLLNETTAARDMMDRQGSLPMAPIKPVAASLRRSDKGGMLNNRELLDIAAVLRTARNVAAYGDEGTDTCLRGLFRSLTTDRVLEDAITGSILSEEEIADSASPELASIRRHIRATSGKAREVLQKLISSQASKYLQEAIITIRSDRFVVPVKAEYRSMVPGLVHDVSSTGSTYFIEPMGAVQANNELRELMGEEEKEIERILRTLSADCAAQMESIIQNYDLLIQLDAIFARAKLSTRLNCMPPRLEHNGGFRYRRARHPLLDQRTAVPIDLRLGEDFDTLVITGPNTGGKTVALKTAGLLTVMAQCGLHIPAGDDSYCSVFSQVLADIGDEQSIEQSLSTFSAHMTNTVHILAQADERTLILYDELGAGTDPIEGAALAEAIIEESRSLGAKVCATTHYAELKLYAMTTEGVENACCEFDVESLRPTYRLLIGIPGKSNAFAISRRLGLPEHVIDRAGAHISEENVRFEDVITQLEQQRRAMEAERLEAARLRQSTKQDADAARDYRRRLEEDRERLLRDARAQAEAIVREAREMSELVFTELSDMRKQAKKEQNAQQVNEQRAAVRRLINETEERTRAGAQVEAPPPTRPAVAGDVVELIRMGTQADVLSVNKDGTLQLQAGILKITAKQEEVRVVEDAASRARKQRQRQTVRATQRIRASGVKPELDLRGMMTDEALDTVDRYLDDALLAHLSSVTIIHGKGTGALRTAVRRHLKTSKYVKSFRPGRFGDGEDGVTVVELK
ncbi:MAG: endonuclease MutS2, partial [Oscillospiraceae bacterium]|nr:endonuclease MutS2 [Oscillospiraceae bacterium]